MGNSISLNFLTDDAHHLTLNSQRNPRNSSHSSFRSEFSSEATGDNYLSSSNSSLQSLEDENCSSAPKSTDKNKSSISSPYPKMRQCWICYGEEEISESPEFEAGWVAPCSCKGTTKWVHQACLLDWIDSQVMNNVTLTSNRVSPVITATTQNVPTNANLSTPFISATNIPEPRFQSGGGPLVLESSKLTCPQCHATYKIAEAYVLPRKILLFIDYLAKAKERVLMWSTLGLISGSIYTVAFSYGIFSGWMVGGQEYLEFIRDSFDPINGNIVNRLQLSAGIPLTPLFALSSAFSMFSWTFPLVPFFLFDGQHRISLSQPRGILLFLPLIWSTHHIIVDSLIPAGFKRITNPGRNQSGNPPISITSEHESSDVLGAVNESSNPTNNDFSSISSSDYSSSDPGSSTVKISILNTTAALLFPTAAALTGWVLSQFLPKSFAKISPFYRSLIGAGALVTLKDFSKLLYWYQTVRLRKYRRVLNRKEE